MNSTLLDNYDRIIVVPGFGATPQDHWFPWLRETAAGATIIELPNPQSPDARTWIPLIAQKIGQLTPRTGIITHSLGGISTLQALQRLVTQERVAESGLGALVMVAPFINTLPPTGEAELDNFIATNLAGFLKGLELLTLHPVLGKITVIHSDNDPLVPAALSDSVASAFEARTVIVPGAGHFLDSDGITHLPQVLDALTD